MSVEIVEKNFDFLIIYKFHENEKDEEYEKVEDNGIKEAKNRIFGEYFVKMNKKNSKIIYKNKEYELTEYFEDIDKNHNYNCNYLILLKLKFINNKIDISHMFYNCKGLLSISTNTSDITSKDVTELEENFFF